MNSLEMDPVQNTETFTHLKVFTEFVCEEKVYSIEDLINASVVLLKTCPFSRTAVLKFYSQLLSEYCYEYCLSNASNSNAKFEKQESTFLQRFLKALHNNQIHKNKRLQDEIGDKAEIKSLEDCPQSPSREIEDYQMEDSTLGISPKDIDLSVIITLFDNHISKVEEILTFLQTSDPDANFASSISDWALDLASELSQKFSSFVTHPNSNHNEKVSKLGNLSLMSALGFWIQCPAMQLLTRIVFTSACVNKTEAKTLCDRLLKYSPYSDWILAHLCTNISQSINLNVTSQTSPNAIPVTSAMNDAAVTGGRMAESLVLALCAKIEQGARRGRGQSRN